MTETFPDNHGKTYPATWELRVMLIRWRASNRCEGTPRFLYCEAVNGKEHPEEKFSFKVMLTARGFQQAGPVRNGSAPSTGDGRSGMD